MEGVLYAVGVYCKVSSFVKYRYAREEHIL